MKTATFKIENLSDLVEKLTSINISGNFQKDKQIKLPRYLSNEIEVLNDGKTLVYVGEIKKLWFDKKSVRGIARLNGYEKEERTKIRYIGFHPFYLGKREIRYNKKTNKWKIYSCTEDSYYSYFICDGQSSEDYRTNLIKNGKNNLSLEIKPRLLDLIFDPLDKEIKDAYYKILNSDHKVL